MKYSDLDPKPVSYGKRIIVEENKTVRVEFTNTVGTFDGKTIWRMVYLSGPKRGEVRESYSLPTTFQAYTVFGKLIPTGRLIQGE